MESRRPATIDSAIRLSKSRYTTGLQCSRWLWLSVHQPDAPELIPNETAQAIMEQGTKVGELARSYVPGGVLIDLPHDALSERVAATQQAIERGERIIYEASFFADDVFVAVDVLERNDSGWTIVEVKSTARVKPEHLPDVAIQTHVLRRSGLDVTRAELMHLNRECVHPDLSNLFTRTDVTGYLDEALAAVPPEIERQLAMLRGPIPKAEIDCHCREPYPCPLKDDCWQDLPRHHVTTIYYAGNKAFEMMKQGYQTVDQVPPEMLTREVAARQQRAVKADTMIVEGDLAATLEPFSPPIAYLDFESINPAIPLWPGCRPFDQVPVQFSCHIEREDGSLAHREWLAEAASDAASGPADPRPALARAVIAACRDAKAVAMYTPFEHQCLEHLADAVPELAGELEAVDRRLVDLHPCVRDHVYHPDFRGSFSIKNVLPALVLGLGYDGLAVGAGQLASVRLRRLIVDGEPADLNARRRLQRDLRDYCRMDSMGMVRLLGRLRELAEGL